MTRRTTCRGSNPDVAFIEALIDRLGDELCLDLARVYATGHSNGAIGASVLGCVLADRLAAIAPVAALTDFGDACQEARAVPVLGIHGGADPYVLLEAAGDKGSTASCWRTSSPSSTSPSQRGRASSWASPNVQRTRRSERL